VIEQSVQLLQFVHESLKGDGGEGEKKVEHPSAEKTKEELEKEAEDKQKKSQSEFVKGFSTLDGVEVPSYNDDEEMWTEEKLAEFRKEVGLYEYKTPEDVPVEIKHQLHRGLFPPTEEEVKKWNLERCMRIQPQDMNTGGFFVTVFRKLKPIGSVKKKQQHLHESKGEGEGEAAVKEDSNASTTTTTTTTTTTSTTLEDSTGNNSDDETKGTPAFGGRKKPDADKKGGKLAVANQQFIPVTDEFYDHVKKFYGLNESTPKSQFFARTESAKSVMFLTNSVKQILDTDTKKRFKIVHSGVQAFEKNSKGRSTCEYRLHHEGMATVVPHLDDTRKLKVNNRDFSVVIKHALTSNQHQIDVRQFSPDIKEKVEALAQGCFVVVLKEAETRLSDKLMMTLWKNTASSCHSLVSKVDLGGLKSKMEGGGHWEEVELVEEYMKEAIRKPKREEQKKEGGEEEKMEVVKD